MFNVQENRFPYVAGIRNNTSHCAADANRQAMPSAVVDSSTDMFVASLSPSVCWINLQKGDTPWSLTSGATVRREFIVFPVQHYTLGGQLTYCLIQQYCNEQPLLLLIVRVERLGSAAQYVVVCLRLTIFDNSVISSSPQLLAAHRSSYLQYTFQLSF